MKKTLQTTVFAVLALVATAGEAQMPGELTPGADGRNHPGMHSDDHANHHHVLAEKLWKKEQAAYDKLESVADGKSLENVFGADAVKEALENKDVEVTIGCIDERVGPMKGTRKVAIAGSTVLLNDDQLAIFVKKLHAAGVRVKKVTYHEECGACALACKQLGMEPTKENMEKLGKTAAKKLMSMLDMEGEPEREGYSEQVKPEFHMDGNRYMHHARAVYIDGRGTFNSRAMKIPAGFDIEARFAPDDAYLNAELDVAIGIAFGDHGFGRDRFDSKKGGKPLLIGIIDDPSDANHSYESMRRRLKSTLDKYGQWVRIMRISKTTH